VLDGAIALGLVAIVVAAIVNVFESNPAEAPVRADATTQPQPDEQAPGPTDPEALPEQLPQLIPVPGKLRDAGGTLWWSGVDCRSGSLELSSGAVARVSGEHCRIWPSPDGHAQVALASRRADALEGRGLVYLVPAEGEERIVSHTRGVIGSEVAWSPDGSGFAVCLATREGTVVDVRHSLPGGRGTLAGTCFPAWLADGRLALAAGDPVEIRAGDDVLLGADELKEIFPSVPKDGHRAVSALAGQGDRLVAALAVVSPTRFVPAASAVAVLGPGGIEFEAKLTPGRVLPAAVGLSPPGDALWYLDAAEGQVAILTVPGGRRVLALLEARWLAWSPDGAYLAAAGERGITILEWPSGEELAVVPVDATAVAWTRTAR
jgi:hypothetical protein